MHIVVSGVRPTGKQHLGNYFGAVVNFVKMQQEPLQRFYFVADYHSLTTHPHPDHLSANVRQTLTEYLACGVDPVKSVVYLQSDVPQIPELYLIFNMLAYLGELERSATFKEKVRDQPDNVNAGLLTYPVLMAVDILVHRAHRVPVGKDQQQHIEMTRDFAKRFNSLYGSDFFPEPVAFSYDQQLTSVPSLDGEGKMSKSKGEHTCIYLADTPEEIRKKIMRAVTDQGPQQPNQEKPQAIRNIFQLMSLVSTSDTVRYFDEQYNGCTIRYGDMKKQLAEDMIQYLAPIREKITAYAADDQFLQRVMKQGAEQARESAEKTLQEARKMIGFSKLKN